MSGRPPKALGNSSTAVGATASASAIQSTAVGVGAEAEGVQSMALGAYSEAGADGSIAIGTGAQTGDEATNSVALCYGSEATEANTVSIGAVGSERRLTNVAAGINDTDAVNMAQLSQFYDAVDGFADTTSAMLDDHESRIVALENVTFNLGETLGRLDEEIDGSTAVAVAMTGNALIPGKQFAMTGNVGTYNGAWAASLQLGAMVAKDMAVNAGIATGFNKGGKTGARVGFTLGW
ncbi:YadA-like family protein [Sphingomicrobium arenosum]|uniref:YadA-like family protein n=1 Tax=Sphingomicrobium arenosum TaxID=2233861 RepID=UPI0022402E7B|nr:YadA-like family protein [Sphingomicrobium arenosum]